MRKKERKVKKIETNKLKTTLFIAATIALTIFVILFSADPFTCENFYLGTTISAYQPQTEHGSKTRIVVKLDDGRNVDVKQTIAMGPITNGKRIIVQECTTMILRRIAFRFIKYVDDKSSFKELEQLNEVIKKNGV